MCEFEKQCPMEKRGVQKGDAYVSATFFVDPKVRRMKMTLKELLEIDIDVDVSSDYADTFHADNGREMDAYIAFCPGDKLTSEGHTRWDSILNLEVTITDCDAVVHIPNTHELIMEKIHDEVFMMFYTFAGCVSEDFYKRMIEC